MTEDLIFSRVSEKVLAGQHALYFLTEPISSNVSVFDDFYEKRTKIKNLYNSKIKANHPDLAQKIWEDDALVRFRKI